MYNGIGLPTARGSGTNGYVQANRASLILSKQRIAYNSEADIRRAEAELNRQPNAELLEHMKKRQIELKCADFEMLMENKGFDEAEIEKKVNEYRKLLLSQVASGELDIEAEMDAKDSHARAKAAMQNRDRMRAALDIDDNFVDGSSFEKINRKDEMEHNGGEKTDADSKSKKSKKKEELSSKKMKHRSGSSSSSSSSSPSSSESSSTEDSSSDSAQQSSESGSSDSDSDSSTSSTEDRESRSKEAVEKGRVKERRNDRKEEWGRGQREHSSNYTRESRGSGLERESRHRRSKSSSRERRRERGDSRSRGGSYRRSHRDEERRRRESGLTRREQYDLYERRRFGRDRRDRRDDSDESNHRERRRRSDDESRARHRKAERVQIRRQRHDSSDSSRERIRKRRRQEKSRSRERNLKVKKLSDCGGAQKEKRASQDVDSNSTISKGKASEAHVKEQQTAIVSNAISAGDSGEVPHKIVRKESCPPSEDPVSIGQREGRIKEKQMQEDQLSCRLECDVGESAAENKEVVTLGSHPEFLAQQASRRESDERGSQKAATEEIDEVAKDGGHSASKGWAGPCGDEVGNMESGIEHEKGTGSSCNLSSSVSGGTKVSAERSGEHVCSPHSRDAEGCEGLHLEGKGEDRSRERLHSLSPSKQRLQKGRCSEEVRVSRDRSPSRHSSGKHASRHGSPYPVEVNPRSSRSKSASEGGRRSRGSYSRSLSLDSTERSSTGSSVEEQKLKHKSRDGSDRASSRARHDSTSSSTPLSDYSVERSSNKSASRHSTKDRYSRSRSRSVVDGAKHAFYKSSSSDRGNWRSSRNRSLSSEERGRRSSHRSQDKVGCHSESRKRSPSNHSNRRHDSRAKSPSKRNGRSTRSKSPSENGRSARSSGGRFSKEGKESHERHVGRGPPVSDLDSRRYRRRSSSYDSRSRRSRRERSSSGHTSYDTEKRREHRRREGSESNSELRQSRGRRTSRARRSDSEEKGRDLWHHRTSPRRSPIKRKRVDSEDEVSRRHYKRRSRHDSSSDSETKVTMRKKRRSHSSSDSSSSSSDSSSSASSATQSSSSDSSRSSTPHRSNRNVNAGSQLRESMDESD